MVMTGIAIALLLVASMVACGEEEPLSIARKSAGPEPVQTARAEGEHGLKIEVSAPEKVGGGDPFTITVDVSDDEGEIAGVEVDWGDGKVWGGIPMDLVCTATAGEPKPTEPPSSQTEELEHAYRNEGPVTIKVSAYSGGCWAHWDRAAATITTEVVDGTAVSNGPLAPRASIGHAYYINGDRSVLVSDIGGYDEDGFVSRIEIDWGDGTEIEVLERQLSGCDEGGGWPGGWFSKPTKHRYESENVYSVQVTVTSVGCDGAHAQTDSDERELEFPPEQGT